MPKRTEAIVEVLGEEVRRTVPIPSEGTDVRNLFRTAGHFLRDNGWDYYLNGIRSAPTRRITASEVVEAKAVPRTRGA